MSRLVIASRNPDKIEEIRALLQPLGLTLVGMEAFQDLPETVEDRPTLQGNAAKKAVEVARHTGLWAMADDTGLEVDSLAGAPGVYSARYAGEDATYRDNRLKLLAELEGVAKGERRARFRTVVVLASPGGEVVLSEEGVCQGRITRQERGSKGFGYDSIFEAEESGRTFAEMEPIRKNAISHRGRALEAFAAELSGLLGERPELLGDTRMKEA